MNSYKRLTNLVGWGVFLFAAVVYYFSAERTGSLWDCGEFAGCADKLQVPHPPGAPLFLLIGRLFMWVGGLLSNDPSFKTHLLNFSSGVYSALAAMFVCWVTIILGKLAMVGRDEEPNRSQFFALAGAGAVAGLTTAFCTSIWFSAVEGEVYAMSTFFTAFTFWAMIKWYNQPDTPQADRWMMLSVYAAGLSIGVHLLSLLTFPALALFYYFKKTERPTLLGMAGYGLLGVVLIGLIQAVVITGVPALWGNLEVIMANMGLPRYIGSLVVLMAILGGGLVWGFRFAKEKGNTTIQNAVMGLTLLIVSFTCFGMTMIRAAANPPINMNAPSDPLRMIPYLNREQYGERPLLFGPQFNQKRPAMGYDKVADRYGWTGKKYEVVDQRMEPVFAGSQKMFFPRMGHWEGDREPYYKYWLGIKDKDQVPRTRPTFGDNISYFVNYQCRWMYWRYFMWNFSGRQNGEQGYTPSEMKGHWITGISFIDETILGLPGKTANMSSFAKTDPARNTYFMLPFLFGLLGAVWHFRNRRNDALGILALFLITGLGIVIYTNEPPNEPRERDYALVGSFFTFAIWVGMGVLALYDLLKNYTSQTIAAPVATAVIAVAPMLMLTQNFDDHSRREHYAARDYAVNFLESCDKNAIIFTFGDNDTYPLWYAQEVENIRTDVRVVNLSLLGTDRYINQLRRKVNTSPAIKLSIPEASIRGDKRQQIPVMKDGAEMSLADVVKFIGESHPQSTEGGYTFESYAPAKKVFLPVDKQKMLANGLISATDTAVVDKIPFELGDALMRDDIAVLDIIANNFSERPIYFAVTAASSKMQGLNSYAQLEGLAVRLLPIGTYDPMGRQFGIIGAGRVASDKVFDRIMNKFKWGNFDKIKTHIDKNYRPSVQTTQFVALRTAMYMAQNNDQVRAVQLMDKIFEAYPNMNFPYDRETLYFLDVYSRAGDAGKESFKKHARILAKNVVENLNFYKSVSGSIRRLRGIDIDEAYEMQLKDEIIRLSANLKDAAFDGELKELFKDFPLAAPMPANPIGN